MLYMFYLITKKIFCILENFIGKNFIEKLQLVTRLANIPSWILGTPL